MGMYEERRGPVSGTKIRTFTTLRHVIVAGNIGDPYGGLEGSVWPMKGETEQDTDVRADKLARQLAAVQRRLDRGLAK